MTALALAQTESDTRAELAATIERHAALVAKVEAASKALNASEEAIAEAQDKLKRAKVTAEEAPARMAKHQVDTMVSGVKTRPPISSQAANDALKRAEDELAALQSYRQELETQRQKTKDSRDFCAMNLRGKRAAVLRASSEVKALLAKYRAARDELYRLAATLHAASEALSTSSSTNSSL